MKHGYGEISRIRRYLKCNVEIKRGRVEVREMSRMREDVSAVHGEVKLRRVKLASMIINYHNKCQIKALV